MIYTYIIPMPNLEFSPIMVSGGFKSIMSEILITLCGHCGVTINCLSSKTRHGAVKVARWIFWKVMTSQGFTYKEVGLMLPGRAFDHTTVVNAMSKLEADVEKDPEVREAYKSVIHFDREPYTI